MPHDHMKDVVFAHHERFARIYTTYGHTSLTAYAGAIYAEMKGMHPVVRDVLRDMSTRILGSSVGKKVEESLEKNNYVSTVDHHGPLSYPGFFQPNLLRTVLDTEKGLTATIVLSCASVSLDNHTYPRGLYFFNDLGVRVRIPFFSLHDRHVTVYGQRPFTMDEAMKQIARCGSGSDIKEKLYGLCADDSLYRHTSYREQITYLNYMLMRNACPEGGAFVSISVEDVVREILSSSSSFLTPDMFISRILFDTEVRNVFLAETNGIQTSHDFLRKDTTVLFWGQRNGVRVPLRIAHEYLVDETNDVQIHLDAHSIQTALQEERIFPNLALCLIVLSLCGMNLGGGFFQVDYLPRLIEHAQKVALHFGFDEILWGTGDYLGGDFTFMPKFLEQDVTALAILKNPPHASDLTFFGDHITVAEAIDRAIPDMYHILDNRLRNEWAHIVMNTIDSV